MNEYAMFTVHSGERYLRKAAVKIMDADDDGVKGKHELGKEDRLNV